MWNQAWGQNRVYPNSVEAILLFPAAAVAGTAAPLNPTYKQEEFAFYLADTRARMRLVPPSDSAARPWRPLWTNTAH